MTVPNGMKIRRKLHIVNMLSTAYIAYMERPTEAIFKGFVRIPQDCGDPHAKARATFPPHWVRPQDVICFGTIDYVLSSCHS